jgi:hypothetical protein
VLSFALHITRYEDRQSVNQYRACSLRLSQSWRIAELGKIAVESCRRAKHTHVTVEMRRLPSPTTIQGGLDSNHDP